MQRPLADDALKIVARRGWQGRQGRTMKITTGRPFGDPDQAARRLQQPRAAVVLVSDGYKPLTICTRRSDRL